MRVLAFLSPSWLRPFSFLLRHFVRSSLFSRNERGSFRGGYGIEPGNVSLGYLHFFENRKKEEERKRIRQTRENITESRIFLKMGPALRARVTRRALVRTTFFSFHRRSACGLWFLQKIYIISLTVAIVTSTSDLKISINLSITLLYLYIEGGSWV